MTEHEEFQLLWDLLVPSMGKAETAQGEVIRIAGRVQHEFLDNGCMNWDDDFRKMLDAFLRYLQLGNGFSKEDLMSAELLVQLLKENGGWGGDRRPADYCIMQLCHGLGETKSHTPLPPGGRLYPINTIFASFMARYRTNILLFHQEICQQVRSIKISLNNCSMRRQAPRELIPGGLVMV